MDVTTNLAFAGWPTVSADPKMTTALRAKVLGRLTLASLRHHRDRQQLALQEPRLTPPRPHPIPIICESEERMRLSIGNHAWSRGFHDGEAGKPLRACPYAVGINGTLVMVQRLHRS